MKLSIHPTALAANQAAAARLTHWLALGTTRNIMAAAGNTPLELYRLIGEKHPPLSHLRIFALDEYVGVPLEEPRNCANLLRRCLLEPWGIPPGQFHVVSSLEPDALRSVQAHERLLSERGGLDVIVLGLGQNGHLGFNEPGSAENSAGRLLDLEGISIEANRKWFQGDYAPAQGITVGLKTILAARQVLIMAYGTPKSAAVAAMIEGPRGVRCPASLLQGHLDVWVFLDEAAAANLTARS